MQHGESKEQASLMYWATLATQTYPDLKWLHCSLNGVKLSIIQAKIAKSQGMKAGIADLFLPVKRGEYSGFFIEMKYNKNKLTKEQQNFLEYVKSQGFLTAVCYGWIEAKELLIKYLNQ